MTDAPGTPHERMEALIGRIERLLAALDAELDAVGYGASSLAEIAEGHLSALRGIVQAHGRICPAPSTAVASRTLHLLGDSALDRSPS